MRVSADTTVVQLAPGATTDVDVDVVNTGATIDGFTARVIGIPAQHVRTSPQVLPLFPDAGGRLRLTVGVPTTYPAGRHPLTVEVASETEAAARQLLDLDLEVAPHPNVRIYPRPELVQAHREATYLLTLVNDGNVPLSVDLAAVDADRALRVRFAPPTVELGPGTVATSLLTVRGPRMFLGHPVDRPLQVSARSGTVIAKTAVTLRQKPRITRGVITALVLAGIVALWALAFLLVLRQVLASDPMTKTPAKSFFAGTPVAGVSPAPSAAPSPGAAPGAPGTAGGSGAGAAAAPDGALPKSGPLPPGVGGVLSGVVTAKSDGEPVGRVLVQAYRRSPKGLVEMSSAATQADGSYAVAGLFPTRYLLRFSGPGFVTSWYPHAPGSGTATSVAVTSGAVTGGVNAVVAGTPASISGSVDPGDTVKRPTTTVQARPVSASGATKPTATATTSAKGSFVLKNLPAPGTYQLSFATAGYQPTTVDVHVDGGQQRIQPTVKLSSAAGSISGTVRDAAGPLGGVTVSTSVAGTPVKTGTPTTGSVGAFVLSNLPTPQTYVLTFAKKGYGGTSLVIDLGPGQGRTGLTVDLVGGTGTVTGVVADGAGHGLGGVTVTVGGLPKPVTTTTLTNGTVGSFTLSGLPVGSYTLTASLTGYEDQTVPVTISSAAAPSPVRIQLTRDVGAVSGVISDGAAGVVGAQVSVTDGVTVWTATSTQAFGGHPDGYYVVPNLAPGSYTVTVTSADGSQLQTALVFVTAGTTTTVNLPLGTGG